MPKIEFRNFCVFKTISSPIMWTQNKIQNNHCLHTSVIYIHLGAFRNFFSVILRMHRKYRLVVPVLSKCATCNQSNASTINNTNNQTHRIVLSLALISAFTEHFCVLNVSIGGIILHACFSHSLFLLRFRAHVISFQFNTIMCRRRMRFRSCEGWVKCAHNVSLRPQPI